MIAKMTSKNQITIPKKISEQLRNVNYFDVELQNGVVVLRPLKLYAADLARLRSKIEKLGLKEDSVAEAIKWARAK